MASSLIMSRWKGGIEDELDVHVLDAFYLADGRGDLAGENAGGRAARRRQRHPDVHAPRFVDVDHVDQPEVVDVNRDFGGRRPF